MSLHQGPDLKYDLFGRALDAAGAPAGSEFLVNPTSSNGVYGADVAALPTGTVFVWTRSKILITVVNEVTARLFGVNGQPLGPQFKVGPDGASGRDVAATSDGGFAVCWQDNANAIGTLVRTFDGDGTPRGPQQANPFTGLVQHVAASPSDGGGALLTTSDTGGDLAALRFAADGTLVGNLAYITNDGRGSADLEYAHSDHLLAVWTAFDADAGLNRVRARALEGSFAPLLDSFWIADERAETVRITRTADADTFVVAWSGPQAIYGAVVELCTPANVVCGDGTLEPACAEVCDDGGANSDVVPNACRTDCRPAHCGDGVVDSGEACDDGNVDPCDGCDALCTVEIGLVCGDGIPNPACGQSCDDANAISGDGCGADCVAERAYGGGKPQFDCAIEWQIDNPSNVPRYDDDSINPVQTCVDDDPACDFDGGVPGGCTFHVAACAGNTNIDGC